jgi:hypothetical protein
MAVLPAVLATNVAELSLSSAELSLVRLAVGTSSDFSDFVFCSLDLAVSTSPGIALIRTSNTEDSQPIHLLSGELGWVLAGGARDRGKVPVPHPSFTDISAPYVQQQLCPCLWWADLNRRRLVYDTTTISPYHRPHRCGFSGLMKFFCAYNYSNRRQFLYQNFWHKKHRHYIIVRFVDNTC